MRVAIESGKGMKVKVVKLCWNKWNGPFLMHIYDKQCGIMQKNQWKGPNFQIQCFYNGTSGALCWKRQKNTKTRETKTQITQIFEKVWPIKGGTMRKLTSRGFRKCCSFWVLEVLNQSYWPSKLGENWRKNSKERNRNKKKTRPQFWVLCSEIESAGDQHGCFNADSISSRNFQNCGRVFFLLRLIIFGTLSLFQPCVDFERW